MNAITAKDFICAAVSPVFFALLAIFSLLILFASPAQVNHTLLLSLCPCVFACLILHKRGLSAFGRHGGNLWSMVLTVLFLCMLSVKEIFSNGIFSYSPIGFLYLLYLSASTYLTMNFCLTLFLSDRSSAEPISTIGILGPLYVISAILFLCANLPFRPSIDAMTVYDIILNELWNDWHPIGYILFVRICMALASPIAAHPFAACVAQTILWLLIQRLVCGILRRCTGSCRAVNAYRIINLILFVPLMYLGVMYKDVVYSMCVLGFCAECYLIIHTEQAGRKDLVLITLFSIGLSLFRHMGLVVSVFCLLAVGLYFLLRKNRLWIRLFNCTCVTIIAFLLVVPVYGGRILHMKENPDYVKYTVPLYITGNLITEAPELFTEEDITLVDYLMPVEDWSAAYLMNTYLADNLSRKTAYIGDRIDKLDQTYGAELLKLNLRLFLRSPVKYSSALLRITSIVWQIGRPADGYEWTVAGYYKAEDRPDLVPDHLVTRTTILSELLGELEYYLGEQPFLSFLYYRGGIWVFALLFSSAVLILKRRTALLLCILPPAVITVMLMISCPAQDPRFILPMMETAMFFLPAVYFTAASPHERSKKIVTKKLPGF